MPSKLKFVIFLCFCANVLAFMDRANISIAAPFIMQSYGWNEAQMGMIFSAFFVGYVIFMLPGGVVADRHRTHIVMAAGMAWVSVLTFFTPFFDRLGYIASCRFATGAGQSVHFPCINNLIAREVSLSDRVKVQGFTLSGINLGTFIAFPLGSWIIGIWGWPAVFYCFGFTGLVWVFVWLCSARISSVRTDSPGPVGDPTPWRLFFTHRSVLGLSSSYFCHNYAGYLFLTWLPTYFMQVHGLSVASLGLAAAMPALAAVIFMNVSGWVSDYFLKAGKSQDFSRKIMLCLGMGGSGLSLLTLIWVENVCAAVLLLILSSSARALATPVYWTLSVDMSPRHAGILSSIMNTSGNVAGIVAPAATGWMVSYFSDWDAAILVTSAITVLGGVIGGVMIRSEEI